MKNNRGWKVFDKNLQCRGFQFEVGKTYKHDGDVELCKSGFHFHTVGSEIFNYYTFDTSNRVCEIKFSGTVIHGDDKSVASKITIVRELEWGEVLKICNSGDWNSGYRNSGNWNSGNSNSGYRNSGNRNSGDWNSGDWNSGNWNSGYINTTKPPVRIFNKETDVLIDDIKFPNFFVFDLTIWVPASVMTRDEIKDHPYYQTTDGYLKTLTYYEAWRESWDRADDKDRRKVLKLPNWDNEIFKEVSGIDVEQELKEK